MKMYFSAAFFFKVKAVQKALRKDKTSTRILVSYFEVMDCNPKTYDLFWEDRFEVFLDSGAFSAWTRQREISISDLIKFIHNHPQIVDYSNLDVIGDPEKTWQNQLTMEKEGLSPIPCYHYGENVKWLYHYLDHGYDYIALGGMVGKTTDKLKIWLDDIFDILCKNGRPKVKVHGFGMTSFNLMQRYPWFSVDSTTWIKSGGYGRIYLPAFKKGEWNFNETPAMVYLSTQYPLKNETHYLIENCKDSEMRKRILEFIEPIGLKYGVSTYVEWDNESPLRPHERPCVLREGFKEIKLIRGVSNDQNTRKLYNYYCFKEFEKALTKRNKDRIFPYGYSRGFKK